MIDLSKVDLKLIVTCVRGYARSANKNASAIKHLFPKEAGVFNGKIESAFKLADRIQFDDKGKCKFCGLICFEAKGRSDHECPEGTFE